MNPGPAMTPSPKPEPAQRSDDQKKPPRAAPHPDPGIDADAAEPVAHEHLPPRSDDN